MQGTEMNRAQVFEGVKGLRAGLADRSVQWRDDDFISLSDISRGFFMDSEWLKHKIGEFRSETGLDRSESFRAERLYSRDENPEYLTWPEFLTFTVRMLYIAHRNQLDRECPEKYQQADNGLSVFDLQNIDSFCRKVLTKHYDRLDQLLDSARETARKEALGKQETEGGKPTGAEGNGCSRNARKHARRLYAVEELSEIFDISLSEAKTSLRRFADNITSGGRALNGATDSNGLPILDRMELMAFCYWRGVRGNLPHRLNLGSRYRKRKPVPGTFAEAGK